MQINFCRTYFFVLWVYCASFMVFATNSWANSTPIKLSNRPDHHLAAVLSDSVYSPRSVALLKKETHHPGAPVRGSESAPKKELVLDDAYRTRMSPVRQNFPPNAPAGTLSGNELTAIEKPIAPSPKKAATQIQSATKARASSPQKIAATFIVNSNNDADDTVCDGTHCSLREAINAANANVGADVITFAIGAIGSPQTITPGAGVSWPAITDQVFIDGWSQGGAGYTGPPLIEIDGGSITTGNLVLVNIQADNCVIRGISANNATPTAHTGFGCYNGADNAWIYGCYSGLRPDGVTARGNASFGIAVYSSAGNAHLFGTNGDGANDAAERNLVSANGVGIFIQTNLNAVAGNYIGTDITGLVDLGNIGSGIILDNAASNMIGGTVTAARNVIAGNNNRGIEVFGNAADGNQIKGNYIGLGVNGTTALAQPSAGIYIYSNADNTVIGGTTAAERNVISGNQASGIWIENATGTTIQGNYIGTSAAGTAAVGNGDPGGIFMQFTVTNTLIGGTAAGAGNVISGNTSVGIRQNGANVTNNIIQGNYIGTDVTGLVDLGNSGSGIILDNATNNLIGGTVAAARNVIAGNNNRGIEVFGATADNNQIKGNYIGIGATGAIAITQPSAGIFIYSNADNTIIGGTTAAERNVISGNQASGIWIENATGTTIQGNYIGTSAAGTAAVGNGDPGGIFMQFTVTNTLIGGTAAGAGNVISGNTSVGIRQNGANVTNSIIQGNYIGTDVTGMADVGNTVLGIYLVSSSNNLIGGSSPSARNLISGNDTNGIELNNVGAANNRISANYIGVNAAGTAALANGQRGIFISNSPNNTVGTDADGVNDAAERNILSGNGYLGVAIWGNTATGNTIRGNYIGTNAAGTAIIPNVTFNGVEIYAPNNIIGGTQPNTGNLISGNPTGIRMGNPGFTVTGNVVQGNYIGTDVTGTVDLGNASDGILLLDGAANNLIGGTSAAARNIISGNNRVGVYIYGNSNSNTVQGNYIGTNVTGLADLGNTAAGVLIGNGSKKNVIGANGDGINDAAEGNLIACNDRQGNTINAVNANVRIESAGSDSNLVAGNLIGTNITGAATFSPTGGPRGITIYNGPKYTIIGGATPAMRNIVSGHQHVGVELVSDGTENNHVIGNYIGTNITGTATIGNGTNVQLYSGPDFNYIGTDGDGVNDALEGNLSIGK